MDWPVWEKLAAHLRGIAETLPQKPSAIVVMSGHWEASCSTVTAGAHPDLIYDYYGFPEHTYQLRYPAPGEPALAARIQGMIQASGLPCEAESERGFDHGVFIPFMLAFPEANIPIVEISLEREENPARELQIGQGLAPLRDENILLIATGMSYHNLHFMNETRQSDEASRQFDSWLSAAVEAEPEERNRSLLAWDKAPAARFCHPRGDHILPLLFAAGAGGSDKGVHDFRDVIMGKALSGFRFG